MYELKFRVRRGGDGLIRLVVVVVGFVVVVSVVVVAGCHL